jgi:short-subunit dehydrogenase
MGIGEAIARKVAAEGANLALFARSEVETLCFER